MKKELIYVNEDFARKYESIDEANEQVEALKEYMKSLKKDIRDEYKENLAVLKEDLIIYTGLNLQVRQSFEKAKNEAINASYKLWENYEKEKSDIEKKINKLNDSLLPLTEKLDSINSSLKKINTYQLKEILDIIKRFSRMNKQEQKVFELLLEHKGD